MSNFKTSFKMSFHGKMNVDNIYIGCTSVFHAFNQLSLFLFFNGSCFHIILIIKNLVSVASDNDNKSHLRVKIFKLDPGPL